MNSLRNTARKHKAQIREKELARAKVRSSEEKKQQEHLEQVKQENLAATKLQAGYRGKLERQQVTEIRQGNQAAKEAADKAHTQI